MLRRPSSRSDSTRPPLKPQAPGRLPGCLPGCVTHPSSHRQVTHISCRRLLAGAMPRPESAPKPSSALPRVWVRLGSLGVSVVITICAPAADQVFVHDCPSHRHTRDKQRSSAAQRNAHHRQQKKTSSRVTTPPKRDPESRTHGPAASCKRAVMGQLNPPLPPETSRHWIRAPHVMEIDSSCTTECFSGLSSYAQTFTIGRGQHCMRKCRRGKAWQAF